VNPAQIDLDAAIHAMRQEQAVKLHP